MIAENQSPEIPPRRIWLPLKNTKKKVSYVAESAVGAGDSGEPFRVILITGQNPVKRYELKNIMVSPMPSASRGRGVLNSEGNRNQKPRPRNKEIS